MTKLTLNPQTLWSTFYKNLYFCRKCTYAAWRPSTYFGKDPTKRLKTTCAWSSSSTTTRQIIYRQILIVFFLVRSWRRRSLFSWYSNNKYCCQRVIFQELKHRVKLPSPLHSHWRKEFSSRSQSLRQSKHQLITALVLLRNPFPSGRWQRRCHYYSLMLMMMVAAKLAMWYLSLQNHQTLHFL